MVVQNCCSGQLFGGDLEDDVAVVRDDEVMEASINETEVWKGSSTERDSRNDFEEELGGDGVKFCHCIATVEIVVEDRVIMVDTVEAILEE